MLPMFSLGSSPQECEMVLNFTKSLEDFKKRTETQIKVLQDIYKSETVRESLPQLKLGLSECDLSCYNLIDALSRIHEFVMKIIQELNVKEAKIYNDEEKPQNEANVLEETIWALESRFKKENQYLREEMDRLQLISFRAKLPPSVLDQAWPSLKLKAKQIEQQILEILKKKEDLEEVIQTLRPQRQVVNNFEKTLKTFLVILERLRTEIRKFEMEAEFSDEEVSKNNLSEIINTCSEALKTIPLDMDILTILRDLLTPPPISIPETLTAKNRSLTLAQQDDYQQQGWYLTCQRYYRYAGRDDYGKDRRDDSSTFASVDRDIYQEFRLKPIRGSPYYKLIVKDLEYLEYGYILTCGAKEGKDKRDNDSVWAFFHRDEGPGQTWDIVKDADTGFYRFMQVDDSSGHKGYILSAHNALEKDVRGPGSHYVCVHYDKRQGQLWKII